MPFIRSLSKSQALAKADSAEQNQISNYLSNTLLKHPDVFSEHLTIQQAGGAFERTGKVIKCLEFYEMIWKHQIWPANEDDQQFARERWLMCKKHQIEIADSESRKCNIWTEIQRRAREWNVDISRLPEFPEVDLDSRPKLASSKSTSSRVFTPEGIQENAPSVQEPLFVDEPLAVPKRQKSDMLTTLLDDGLKQTQVTETSAPKPPASDSQQPKIEICFEIGGQRFICVLDRSRGKMTLKLKDEMEVVTFLSKGLIAQGSDDEISAQIEKIKHHRNRAEYHISP